MKVKIKKMEDFNILEKELIWEGTLEQIFNKFDYENNRLRYCNGYCYKFKDIQIQKNYYAWYDSLDKSTKFEMYYGNGTVD